MEANKQRIRTKSGTLKEFDLDNMMYSSLCFQASGSCHKAITELISNQLLYSTHPVTPGSFGLIKCLVRLIEQNVEVDILTL